MVIKDFKINNKKSYERYKEKTKGLSMRVNKWKLFQDTPSKKAMIFYFENPKSTKKHQAKPRMTLTVSTHEDLRNAVKNGATITVKYLTSINDLNNLLIIVHNESRKLGTEGRPNQCHLFRQQRIRRYYIYKSKRQRRKRRR